MQVWSENELVGELHARPEQIRGHRMALEWLSNPDNFLVPGGFDDDHLIPAPVVKRLEFEFKRMRVRIDDLQKNVIGEQGMSEFLRQNRVPADAERGVDMARAETIYAWKVLDLTPRQVEEIFDLDVFEPLEFGAPDLDRFMSERLDRYGAFGP